MRSFRELEKTMKGAANHRRIEILFSLEKNPGQALFDIANNLGINFKTAHEHVRRLTIAGLVQKRSLGHVVSHTLSKTGAQVLKFLRTLE